MLIMNWANPRHDEQQPLSASMRQQTHAQADWMVASNQNAPFECIRIFSEGLKNITEVASIDTVKEQFLRGGGSIARPKMHIPGIGTLISCRDCVGHMFSFLETEIPTRPEKITGIS